MSQRFKIELPADCPAEEAKTLVAEVKAMEDVQNAGTLTARSLDPASIGLWVQLASGIVTATAAAVPVIQRIAELLRGRGVKGAKLTFADGTVLTVDDISAHDLKNLLNRA
jgi:hypothetical protein